LIAKGLVWQRLQTFCVVNKRLKESVKESDKMLLTMHWIEAIIAQIDDTKYQNCKLSCEGQN
jgi:hypothetical protein